MTDWFRSWHGAPTDNKWLVIARRAGVAPGLVSAVVWALLDHASQAQERGSVSGFDVETYAAFSGFDDAHVIAVIEALTDKGVIADGFLASWDRRQPKREDGAAERAKAWREQKKTPSNAVRTQANASERPREDTDTEKNRTPSVEGECGRIAPDFLAPLEGEIVPLNAYPRAAAKAAKPSRLPDDFALSPAMNAFAREEGLTDDRIEREFAQFRDYWLAASGPNSRKLDWTATWRSWVRKAADGFGGARRDAPSGRGSTGSSRLAAYQRAGARLSN